MESLRALADKGSDGDLDLSLRTKEERVAGVNLHALRRRLELGLAEDGSEEEL